MRYTIIAVILITSCTGHQQKEKPLQFSDFSDHFTDLKTKLGNDEGNEKVDYLKALKPGTINERKKYEDASENNDLSKVIDQNVGAWSEGCQVVFGPEKFYEFWGNVTDKAADSGQRRWYYTIIDADSLETKIEETAE